MPARSGSSSGLSRAISAPIAGTPGIEMVAPCVCSDCTRAVLALIAATASSRDGKALNRIGGGSARCGGTIRSNGSPRPC